MKHALALVLAGLSQAVISAPFIVADPVAVGSIDSAAITVNGGAPVACTLETVTGGVRPKCDVGSLAFGTYTIVLTYTKAAGCTSTTDSATCTQGGTASAAPFSYVYRAGSVTAPVARRLEP